MINPTINNPDTASKVEKIEMWAFRSLLIGVFLAPLAFLPTNYVTLDLVKAFVIAAVVVISFLLYSYVVWKEKTLSLPPRTILWSSIAVVVSAIASALAAHPIAKSFFGQGFELDTAGFIIILFAASLLAYIGASRKSERVVTLYVASVLAFLILELLHLLRFIFGSGFLSLGILSSLTSTILGNWYAFAAYALAVMIITVSALVFLPLSSRMRLIYGLVGVAAFITAFFVNNSRMWGVAALVFLGLTVYSTFSRPKSESSGIIGSWVKRISWLPFIVLIVTAVFAWKGAAIAGPAISKVNGGYSELQLPWQQTLDVGAGAIKDSPILGAGPNKFTQAYIANKPAGINATDAWSVEFGSGFGLIPTFFVTQGLFGIIAWIVFFVFFGILGAQIFRKMPTDPHPRFIIVSSYAAATFLWIILLVSVPPHAIVFLTFIITGACLGAAASLRSLPDRKVSLTNRYAKIKSYSLILAVIIAAILGVIYAKDAIAMIYFGEGVKALNVSGNPSAADNDFSRALALNDSDIFWQARAEAGIAAAQALISSVNSSSPASTTQAVATKVAAIINQSLGYAQRAIVYDPYNYYNYVSEARVSSLAVGINMANAYDAAVKAYTQAIQLNPQNPSLYLSLAQLQAQANKLPDALQTVGAALQVKNNYLDAVYLLSQIEAAQGNLKDAITAAQVAIQLSPQNPILFFQLGLLAYEAGDYSDAATALEDAIKLESDYANARYFLGLAYSRLGLDTEALSQFSQLAATNPDNQTLGAIIQTIQSGKSLFTPATAPAAAATKESKLPLKEKSQ